MPKKEDFQKELKEKVKEGIKPSQLKRSRSTEHLAIPKPDIPLTKSKSSDNILTSQPSLSEQIRTLKQDLVFSQNTAQNYLQRLQKLEPELDNKETEIKQLKKDKEQLEQTNNSLVDKNNELRLQALKDDDKIKEHDQELKKAVNKLVDIQQSHTNYKVQNQQLLREKSDLEHQLKNSQERIQKLYQLKGLPNTAQTSYFPRFRTLLLTGLLIVATIYLLRKE